MWGLTPSELIVWTYAFVFAATAVAAFVGMLRMFDIIKDQYVNRLVYVLIAEVLVGGAAHATRALDAKDTPGAECGDESEFRPQLQKANAKVADLQGTLKKRNDELKSLHLSLDRTKAKLEALQDPANDVEPTSDRNAVVAGASQGGLYDSWCVDKLRTPPTIDDVDRAKEDLVKLVQADDGCADALPTTRTIFHLDFSKVDGEMLCRVVPVAGGPSREARDCLRRRVQGYAKRRLQEGDEWKCCIRLDPVPS